jgi:transposase
MPDGRRDARGMTLGRNAERQPVLLAGQSSERLMTVPGIGPLISSAMVAAIGTGDVFSKDRDFGAWLGLVPKQLSTGDRTILGKYQGAAIVTCARCSCKPRGSCWSK